MSPSRRAGSNTNAGALSACRRVLSQKGSSRGKQRLGDLDKAGSRGSTNGLQQGAERDPAARRREEKAGRRFQFVTTKQVTAPDPVENSEGDAFAYTELCAANFSPQFIANLRPGPSINPSRRTLPSRIAPGLAVESLGLFCRRSSARPSRRSCWSECARIAPNPSWCARRCRISSFARQRSVSAFAVLARLERVVRAKSARQKAKAEFQVRDGGPSHGRNRVVVDALLQEGRIEAQQCPVGRECRGVSPMAISSSS